MDFPVFYKESEAHFLGADAQLIGLQYLQLEFRLGKTPSRCFRPMKTALFYDRFVHHVHLGFHLLMMVLGASGRPPCGCVVNP
ncbi:hypothetical protein Tco_0856786 [Tanacetum coccineum]|uniref:Uncharacterized protein n=1 Tax=Tanacetum coccineum TaxID=301880 RepID=A0ABQ5B9Z7_9ASTR